MENDGLDVQPIGDLFEIGPLGWGSEPIWVEGIGAYIILSIQSENVEWYALDSQGNRVGDALPKDDLEPGCGLALAEDHQTLWYELVIAQVG